MFLTPHDLRVFRLRLEHAGAGAQLKKDQRNGPCASKAAALAAEHEVMTAHAASEGSRILQSGTLAMKRRKNNGPCASKVAALAAEHEVMTGLAANAVALKGEKKCRLKRLQRRS